MLLEVDKRILEVDKRVYKCKTTIIIIVDLYEIF